MHFTWARVLSRGCCEVAFVSAFRLLHQASYWELVGLGFADRSGSGGRHPSLPRERNLQQRHVTRPFCVRGTLSNTTFNIPICPHDEDGTVS